MTYFQIIRCNLIDIQFNFKLHISWVERQMYVTAYFQKGENPKFWVVFRCVHTSLKKIDYNFVLSKSAQYSL